MAGIEPVEPATIIGRVGPVAQEPFRLGEDEGVATPRRVARVAFGEDLGPRLGDDPHEVERELEILGIVGLDREVEVVPVDVLGREANPSAFRDRPRD